MKTTFLTLLSTLLLAQSFAQKTVEGVTFSEKHSFKTESFVLNGVGLREKYFIDLYVAGLYLKQKSNQAEQIIAADEPISIRLKIVSNMVTSEKMSATTKEGFMKSLNNNLTPLQKEIDQFLGSFKTIELKSGDLCELVYIPGEGVHFRVNDKELTLVKGLEFKKALFRIWLGKNPADENLKKDLLTL